MAHAGMNGIRSLGVLDISKARHPAGGLNDCCTARDVQSRMSTEANNSGCTGHSHTLTQFAVTKDFVKSLQDAIYGLFYSCHLVTVLLIAV